MRVSDSLKGLGSQAGCCRLWKNNKGVICHHRGQKSCVRGEERIKTHQQKYVLMYQCPVSSTATSSFLRPAFAKNSLTCLCRFGDVFAFELVFNVVTKCPGASGLADWIAVFPEAHPSVYTPVLFCGFGVIQVQSKCVQFASEEMPTLVNVVLALPRCD